MMDSTYKTAWAIQNGSASNSPYGKYSNYTYSWYSSQNSGNQFNSEGYTYYWIAIG